MRKRELALGPRCDHRHLNVHPRKARRVRTACQHGALVKPLSPESEHVRMLEILDMIAKVNLIEFHMAISIAIADLKEVALRSKEPFAL